MTNPIPPNFQPSDFNGDAFMTAWLATHPIAPYESYNQQPNDGQDRGNGYLLGDPESLTSRATGTIGAIQFGVKSDGKTDDTTALQRALNVAGTYGWNVELSYGVTIATAINIPEGVTLAGPFTRRYTTVPTTGAILQRNATGNNTPIITTNGRCGLVGFAINGPGDGSCNGIFINSNGLNASLLTISGCNIGVEGNFKLAILDTVSAHNNTGHGFHNFVDAYLYRCVANVNGNNGFDFETGANTNTLVGCRSEFNTNIGFNYFTAASNIQMGCLADRNGQDGLRINTCTNSTYVGNNIRRNGATSQGVTDHDVNINVQNGSGNLFLANETGKGTNDGGGGYLSPATALRRQNTDSTSFVANNFQGATTNDIVDVTASTNLVSHSNQVFNNPPTTGVSVQTFNGRALVSNVTGTPAASSTTTITLYLPTKATSTFPVIYKLDLSGRITTGTNGQKMSAATVSLVVTRGSGNATATLSTLTNLLTGSLTDWGIGTGATNTYMIAVTTVATDASSIVFTLTNNVTDSSTQMLVAVR